MTFYIVSKNYPNYSICSENKIDNIFLEEYSIIKYNNSNILYNENKKKYISYNNNNIIHTSLIEQAFPITLEKTDIKTNYKIKINDGYIRHKYYNLYLEKTNIINNDFIWILIDKKNNNNHDFIIARYNENINWTRFLQGNVFIYNKNNLNLEINFQTNNNIKIINLQNIGREGHTYLYHIINNYHQINEINIFLQGDPFVHSPDLFELLCMSDEYTDIQSLSLRHLPGSPSYNIVEKYKKNLNGASFSVFKFKHDIQIVGDRYNGYLFGSEPFLAKYKHNDKIISMFLKKCNIDIDKETYEGNLCGLFSIKKKCILSKSIETYKKILDELLSTRQDGYVLEKVWFTIFEYNEY